MGFSGSGIKYAAIAAGSSGDNTLVAAVTDKKIRVLSMLVLVPSDLVIAFESSAGGTALTGDMELGAKRPLVLPFNPEGWFETVAGELLNLELAGATAVAGCFSYVEI